MRRLNNSTIRLLPCVLIAAILTSCGAREVAVNPAVTTSAPEESVTLEAIAVPAGDGASTPFVAATRNGLLLSWLEPVAGSDRVALRMSRLHGSEWTAPVTIIERDDLFVNWADFPSVIEDADGTLFAHWLQKSGEGTYAYDVAIAISRDGGAAWGAPFLLNRDGKQAEHGFVTLAALPDGGIGATWLDGRAMSGAGHDGHGGGDMELRYARIDADGAIDDEVVLDTRTCECCTTGMTMTDDGPVIVYRDRSAEEIRDIALVKGTRHGWTQPHPVNSDGWQINACPVNGPQIDAIANNLATAWFTAANEKGRVYVAFSNDGGATFGSPIRIDDGNPIGRVDIVMLDETSALVTWLEQTARGGTIRARRVNAAGAEAAFTVAESSTARAAGFPRIARVGGDVFFTWTESEADTKRIHVGRRSL